MQRFSTTVGRSDCIKERFSVILRLEGVAQIPGHPPVSGKAGVAIQAERILTGVAILHGPASVLTSSLTSWVQPASCRHGIFCW